jgi:uncharacterized membrane protein
LFLYIVGHTTLNIAGTIGLLGWLDTPMPSPYYLAMMLVLLAAYIAELDHGEKVKRSTTALLLLPSLAAILGVLLAGYLVWTPVGASWIYGIQGRYWIPPAIAAGVGLPHLRGSAKDYRGATALVVLSQFLTLVCLPHVIEARYYQP